MNKITVPNAKIMTNTGFKNVVITHNFKARPVVYAQRSGYRRDRCTFQSAQKDDIIISVNWSRVGSCYRAEVITSIDDARNYETSSISYIDEPTIEEFNAWIKSISENISPLVNEFLLDRNELFLPVGLGWNGIRTAGDINKERKIKEFFSFMINHEDTKNKIVEKALTSKKEGLLMDWSKAEDLPSELRTYAKRWTGSVVNINVQDVWILIYDNNEYTYLTPLPTEGEYGSNYAYSDSGVYDNPPMLVKEIENEMNSTIVKAIKLTFGAYVKEHFSYGIAWKLYVRR